MARNIAVTAVQAEPRLIGQSLDEFSDDVREALQKYPATELLIYPELHLFGDGSPDRGRTEALESSAEPLTGPRVTRLREIARESRIWLVPGSVCERGNEKELFNTQIILSPSGELAGSYRKIFPWRPSEPYVPGQTFVTTEIAHGGIAGLHICYDSWFPETTRQLAWMGAELIINVVKTTTPDRAQELILARSHAIINQTYFLSVNVAGPTGEGQSILVGPEGEVLAQAEGTAPEMLHIKLDLDRVAEVRRLGTAGTNRMWSQFRPEEPCLPLPVYNGRIDPKTWFPGQHKEGKLQ